MVHRTNDDAGVPLQYSPPPTSAWLSNTTHLSMVEPLLAQIPPPCTALFLATRQSVTVELSAWNPPADCSLELSVNRQLSMMENDRTRPPTPGWPSFASIVQCDTWDPVTIPAPPSQPLLPT